MFGPNRMAIPAAAEFLFCRFRRFREIVAFLSDRWIPASFLLEYSCTISQNRRQGQATLAILSMLGFHDGEESTAR